MTVRAGTFLRLSCAALFLSVGVGSMAASTELPPPSEAPLLTVDGEIAVTSDGTRAVFDLPMLRSLPQQKFSTSTVWTEGVHEFAGVPLRALLDSLGVAEDASVSATAINDYAVEIPAEAIEDDAPIIAYEIDGAAFSRREKGPLWIVFPFDLSERYRTEVKYGQSIWQLDRLTVHP
ncbi:molybdopterin-dependent oxidoreductase [Rhodobacter sp. NSM]|uniref:molybdopterin-dependent oxidoreductase n=1 Tax=Rhodobacter sp. NSM TaxID=3457501 RepID=UPI003FD2CD70